MTFDIIDGYVVNGWDREAAIEAIKNRSEKDNEWYVLDYDLEKEDGDYDSIEFTDAQTAYKKFDELKNSVKSNHRLEIIWSPDSSDEEVCDYDNVVVSYFLG